MERQEKVVNNNQKIWMWTIIIFLVILVFYLFSVKTKYQCQTGEVFDSPGKCHSLQISESKTIIKYQCLDGSFKDYKNDCLIPKEQASNESQINSTVSSSGSNEWYEIMRFQGEGIKDTETFTIPSNEWRISYDTKPTEYGESIFAVFVYTSDGKMVGMVGNVVGVKKDSSILRGVGDYYLSINSGQQYTIIAEAKN